jgi:hypothetical protein
MKKLLLLVLLTACADRDNKASIIAKGQNPDLKCGTAKVELDNRLIDVAICSLYNKETKKSIDFVTAVSDEHAFQAFNLKTVTQVKEEEAARAAATKAAEGSTSEVK